MPRSDVAWPARIRFDIPAKPGNRDIDGSGQRLIVRPPRARRRRPIQTVDGFYGKHPDLLERAAKLYGTLSAEDPEVQADFAQRCGSIALAQWHSPVAPTYQYEFTRATPAHPAQHSGEIKFVFGHLVDTDMTDADRKLSLMMQQYWANFARTGDPNGPGVPVWPKYDAKARQYMDLGNNGPVQRAALRTPTCGIVMEKINRDLH